MNPPTITTFTAQPLTKWSHSADQIPIETRRELSDAACDYSIRFARASAYLNARYLGGDHQAGVDASNKVVTALRKAFGFTYPQNDISF